MEPPAADPTPQDPSSSPAAKRSPWKQPAPNGPAVMDASHWPALSEAAAAPKNTKLAAESSSSSSSPAPPVAVSSPSAIAASSSNSQKHAPSHARHKSARRGAGGDHSPRDHPDRTTAAWDHGSAAGGGRGAHRNHNNGGGGGGGGRRGNGTSPSPTGPPHHHGAASGGGFTGRRRGGYEQPFYRHPPPMGMGPYMRGTPPPPPPMTVPPPFMGPPPPPPPPVSPMRPFTGPMVFHDMPSPVSPVSPMYFYGPPPPPEALRGLALAPAMVGPPAYPYFQAPAEPQPEPEPELEPKPEPEPEPDAEEQRAKLLNQIEFYFSKENLCSDVYLRQQMDGQGWVDMSLIATFKKVKKLTNDLQYIKETLQSSSILEMKDGKIRKRHDWDKWVIPRESNPDITSSSASVASPNVNNLTTHLGGMDLDQSAGSITTAEQNHHDVAQNGSPVAEGSSGKQ
ncbi:hypothetical protein U9M48_011259 [Paspalum notatum var. saurae]|uniref:HTH La-type RNA-binding domain-containing protein n=1 Tax=Paspalum notatum var. saurae TaxID=547442 RepID=A0AAQ3SWJ9_PASNO